MGFPAKPFVLLEIQQKTDSSHVPGWLHDSVVQIQVVAFKLFLKENTLVLHMKYFHKFGF